jgi:hypothetical protein
VLARVKLYQEVAMLAAEIEAEFSESVWQMVATAQQIADEEAKRAKAALANKVETFVKMNRQGIRPGGRRVLQGGHGPGEKSELREIPAGQYEVVVNRGAGIPGAKYMLEVGEAMPGVQQNAMISRAEESATV